MARDRERARDRKARRKGLERDNTPGPVDHASGEVDEFQADLVAAAGGEPASPREEAALEREAVAAGGDAGEATATTAERREDERGGGLGRFPAFLKSCGAELRRVQWPDRRQVGQATMVVLGFVALAGAFLGLMDLVASELVDLVVL